ncbi:alpha/beta fold hydrolase [bacterium]|nr:alpha/beta fold hydrolase [bacterium]
MYNSIFLKTIDNVNIAVNWFNNGFDEVVIIAPGWCMTKDSKSFMAISKSFCTNFDVISFDFRGHGKSSGLYTFTSKEIKDLNCIVKFAKAKKYKKIYLIGFSLGAAVSIIYTARNNNAIDKLIAVSAPSEFSKIENQMWRKSAWAETFKKFELSRFLSIRPRIFPLRKQSPIDLVSKITTPTFFIAGKKDPTVHYWHTELLFNKAVCDKSFKLYDDGYHAEDLFLYFEDDFVNRCVEWLKKV